MSANLTLDQIEAGLKEIVEGPQDIEKLPLVEHEASGFSFRVGPMSRDDYEAWDDLKTLENLQHESSGAARNGARKDRSKSDKWLLEHAVYSEKGERITTGIVSHLLNGKGFGPSTHILIEAAAEKNPPRTELTGRFAHTYGFNRGVVVLVRILEKAGMLELLADRLSPETDKVRESAVADLRKWIDTLPFWETVLDAEDAAKKLGLSIYEAAELRAVEATQAG